MLTHDNPSRKYFTKTEATAQIGKTLSTNCGKKITVVGLGMQEGPNQFHLLANDGYYYAKSGEVPVAYID